MAAASLSTPSFSSSSSPVLNNKPRRPARPNYAAIHANPLPLTIHRLPALTIHNPLSILHILHIYLSPLLSYLIPSLALSSHATHQYRAYFDTYTNSVHVTDPETVRALWEKGFFGKGSLSRSEPEWLIQQQKKLSLAGDTSAEVTRKRRELRNEAKRQRAARDLRELEEQISKERHGKDSMGEATVDSSLDGTVLVTQADEKRGLSTIISKITSNAKQQPGGIIEDSVEEMAEEIVAETQIINQEHLQLTPAEAFFLHYALGVLTIFPGPNQSDSTRSMIQPLSTTQLLQLFRRTSYFPPLAPETDRLRPDDPFLVSYAVYHHFRSLGWVIRSGIKFAVDFLLYYRGPAFSHAEFAVLVIPSYTHSWWRTEEGTEYRGKSNTGREGNMDWYWLHAVNRVQAQVRKTLVLVYVEIPPPEKGHGSSDEDVTALLSKYRVSEYVLKRWSPNRNR